MFRLLAAVAATTLALPAFAGGHLTASGDAEAGEKAFRQCVSCHVVVNEAGETLAGKKAKTGPNLYGIVGSTFGNQDYKYSKLVQAANAKEDLIVDEATFVGYVSDPTKFLNEATGESGRAKMTFKVRKEADAINLYAFLSSLQGSPE